jgi:hypothetical protein
MFKIIGKKKEEVPAVEVTHICPMCYEPVEDEDVTINEFTGLPYVKCCPSCHYKGVALEIDKGIADTIMILNYIGLHTRWSCAGHKHGHNNCEPYIVFEPYSFANMEEVKHTMMSLPNSWRYDDDKWIARPSITIRGDMDNYPNYLDDIKQWAEGLQKELENMEEKSWV